MTIRRAFACIAAALLAVPVAAIAQAPRSALIVVGNRTSFGDITLHAWTTFDVTHAVVTGGGSYVGLYMEQVDRAALHAKDGPPRVGVLRLRDYHGPGENAEIARLGGTEKVPAGHYRVYLIADGPASVRLPMSGSTSLRLRPNKAAHAAAHVETDILQDPLEASGRQQIRIEGARTVDFSSITIGRFRAFAGQIAACFAIKGGDCGSATASGVDSTYTGWFVSPLNDLEFTFTLGYDPGVLKPGTYDAVQQALNTTTMQYAIGAQFSLTLQ